jgi:ribosomal protein L15
MHLNHCACAGTGKPALFTEGGQTPFWRRLPKRGAHNPFSYTYDNVLVTELDAFIRMGKLDPRNVITMKHMYDAGLLEKKAYNRNGVKLLNKRPSTWKLRRLERKLGYPLPDEFQIPVELEVRPGPVLVQQGRSVVT